MKKNYIVIVLVAVIVAASATYVTLSFNSGAIGTESFSVDSIGRTVQASDGRLTIQIPSDALVSRTDISINKLQDFGLSGFQVISAYQFGPEGTTFAKPVTLNISYNPNNFPFGVTESNIGVFIQTSTSVEELDNIVVYTGNHIISAQINHFSKIFVGAEDWPNKSDIPIVGEWDRTDGADKYTFYENGEAYTFFNGKGHSGTWKKDGPEGYKYILHWEHGPENKAPFTDWITISSDGQSYSGYNNYDNSVHCVKEANHPPNIVLRYTSDLGRNVLWSTFEVDSSLTSDPESDGVARYWTIISPTGKPVPFTLTMNRYTLQRASFATFTAEEVGNYTLTLEVRDYWGATTSKTITIPVIPNVEITLDALEYEPGHRYPTLKFTANSYTDKPVTVILKAYAHTYNTYVKVFENYDSFTLQPYETVTIKISTLNEQSLMDRDVIKIIYWEAKIDDIQMWDGMFSQFFKEVEIQVGGIPILNP